MKTHLITSQFYGRHILNEAVSATKRLYADTAIHVFADKKTISWLQWLVVPETSEADLPISFSKQSGKLANTVKTIFWLAASIVLGLLIGQL